MAFWRCRDMEITSITAENGQVFMGAPEHGDRD